MANAICWAIANGDWTNAATWADGRIPDTSGTDAVYTNGFIVNVNTNINVALLSNAAKALGTKATPTMTSNGAPSGQVISSNNSGNAFRAFDGVAGGITNWSAGASSGWVGYFGNSFVVKRYFLTQYDLSAYGGGTANAPTSWNLEASNDGISWTILDTASFLLTTGASYQSAILSNTTSYNRHRLNILTANGGSSVTLGEINLYGYNEGVTTVAGGSFNFNTAGVTATTTSLGWGAANFILASLTTGNASLITSAGIYLSGVSTFLNHSGNGNFTITFSSFRADGTSVTGMSKGGNGLLTINGNLLGGINSQQGQVNYQLYATAGNITVNGTIGVVDSRGGGSTVYYSGSGNLIVNGEVWGYNGYSSGYSAYAINWGSPSGTVTINGNVNGGFGYALSTNSVTTINGNIIGNLSFGSFSNIHTVNTTNTLTVNGNVTGGLIGGSSAISAAAMVTVNGSVIGSTHSAILSTLGIPVFINGNVTASSTANAISLTNASAQVFLKGNMINNAGKMAIYAPRIWVDKDTAMTAQFFTSGGADRTLYSADTFPNTPIPANVRSGITFGPDNSLTGTLIIPPTNTVAQGVQVDNTTGTALLTVQEILDEIKNSSDPMAIRLRNSITPEIMGKLLQWAKI